LSLSNAISLSFEHGWTHQALSIYVRLTAQWSALLASLGYQCLLWKKNMCRDRCR